MPTNIPNLKEWKGQMCPRNLALHHPAAAELLKYATGGCPVKSGKPWTRAEIEAAIARGNHSSAQEPEAIEFHMAQVQEKIANKQCRIVLWDDIKDNIPPQLKVSPHWQWCRTSHELSERFWTYPSVSDWTMVVKLRQ